MVGHDWLVQIQCSVLSLLLAFELHLVLHSCCRPFWFLLILVCIPDLVESVLTWSLSYSTPSCRDAAVSRPSLRSTPAGPLAGRVGGCWQASPVPLHGDFSGWLSSVLRTGWCSGWCPHNRRSPWLALATRGDWPGCDRGEPCRRGHMFVHSLGCLFLVGSPLVPLMNLSALSLCRCCEFFKTLILSI